MAQFDPEFEEEPSFETAAPVSAKVVSFPSASAEPLDVTNHEVATLCAVMGDPTGELWLAASSTPPDAFASDEIRRVWSALRRGIPIDDPIALMASARLTMERYLAYSSADRAGTFLRVHLDAVKRAWRERRIAEIAADMASNPGRDISQWSERLDDLKESTHVRLNARSLDSFQCVPKNDPSVLLGNRYLNRGDGLILSSTSGMGKSSISLQMAACFAIGRPFMGLTCNGELKSLFMQSEDSDGDIAEVKESIFCGMKVTDEEKAKIGKNVVVITDRIHRGASFIAELRRQVARHKPDLVWLNPLMAFISGDINDAQDAGEFLREGLNGLNEPPTFGYVIIHHTTKPPKEKIARNWNEVMYDMAGSADLTNWARAIMSLRAAEQEGDFKLVLAKRGRRAGITKQIAQGVGFIAVPIMTLGLRHSTERVKMANGESVPMVYWEPCETEPEGEKAKGGREKLGTFADYESIFPKGLNAAMPRQRLWGIAHGKIEVSKATFTRYLREWVDCGIVKRDDSNINVPRYYLP